MAVPSDLGRFAREGRFELLHHAAQPARAQIEAPAGANVLPLAQVNQDLSRLRTTYSPLPEHLVLPELEPGQSQFVRIAPRREAMTGANQSALLRISNGAGVVIWLPVTAERGF